MPTTEEAGAPEETEEVAPMEPAPPAEEAPASVTPSEEPDAMDGQQPDKPEE